MSNIILLIIHYLILNCDGLLTITKVIMRPPKQLDVGFIFDVDILNADGAQKIALDLLIKGEGCSLELLNNQTLTKIPKLYGGHFGKIQPGATVSVSAIWPTTVLFNRKGYCDMIVFRSKNESCMENQLFHRILFDTTLTSKNVPKIMQRYVDGKKLAVCGTYDQNPFKNCRPINCEEKYFGQRNYFNTKCKLCEPVPYCTCKNSVYDCLHNECYDSEHLISKEDIRMIKEGQTKEFSNKRNSKFDENSESRADQVYIENIDDLLEYADNYEYFSFLNSIHWWGVLDGILIATATVGIYLMICFCVFLCVNMLTNRPENTPRKPSSITFERSEH